MREIKGIKKERRKLYIQLVIAFIVFFTVASMLFLHFRKELRQGELERCYIELKMFSEQSSQMIEVILNDSLKDIENMTVDMMLTKEWDIAEIEEQLKQENVENREALEAKRNDYNQLRLNMEFLGIDLSKVPTQSLNDWRVYIIPGLYVITSFISIRLTTMTQNKKKKKKDFLIKLRTGRD